MEGRADYIDDHVRRADALWEARMELHAFCRANDYGNPMNGIDKSASGARPMDVGGVGWMRARGD